MRDDDGMNVLFAQQKMQQSKKSTKGVAGMQTRLYF